MTIRCLQRGLILLVAMLLTAGCEQDDDAPRERAAVTVEVEAVLALDLEDTVRGFGSLRAMERVVLRPEVAARVLAVHFEEGSEVEAGKLLFELDAEKLTQQRQARAAELRSASIRLADAERQLQRQQELRRRELSSEEALDQARAAREGAEAERDRLQAELALIEAQLSDTRIHAPFAGAISERHVDRGAYVAVGEALATLYQVAPLEANFNLPERHLRRLALGQAVTLRSVADPDARFEGTITFISPAVDEASRTLLVKAEVPNDDRELRPGAFVSADVTLARRSQRPVVSSESLVATRQGYRVYVVENDRAVAREIETGLRQGDVVEVVSGVEAGERVVRQGHQRLDDGQRVIVLEPPAEGADS
ncbi:MAG: efflux RND transporter periplasmic adaptor subunit [Gammaproteobacteria bacterium]|nr:efflux RND transporter periplasmic adaptor subunit [Gammaproteobacteria bacterium]